MTAVIESASTPMLRVRDPGATRVARQNVSRDDVAIRSHLLLISCLIVTVLLPAGALPIKSFEGPAGRSVGLANIAQYFSNRAPTNSVGNSVSVSLATTVIYVALAFVYAYGLTRICMPLRGAFRLAVPLRAPSLLPAISLVYLFGNQGFVNSVLMGNSIYGPMKTKGFEAGRIVFQLLPLATPGIVLGLGYIFFSTRRQIRPVSFMARWAFCSFARWRTSTPCRI